MKAREQNGLYMRTLKPQRLASTAVSEDLEIRNQMEDHHISNVTVIADPNSLRNKISAIRMASPSKLQLRKMVDHVHRMIGLPSYPI
ncbi:hypothetical protein JRO89_XS14G0005200 [Xanthoceras sorbifolium]|uniref:Uncharacterized protein n=1 Tax=Xanthoceras sorbifolium TaxID=99658 RepID=A0ABQ8H328_9ROSI|nr:hypothetical protein JRO89_XS14G0005200 [Xanthoceras sorbifolium]